VAGRRAIVLGKGTLAIQIADWFHRSADYELQHIVPVMPEPAWTESLAGWARAHGVPVVDSGHWRDLPDVPNDIGISVFYDRILPAGFIARFHRLLNLHNSPLPRYRGVSPINWALKSGETSHGVTIHEITPGMDAGPIVAKLEYSIYPEFDEVIDVYKRALEYGWALFRQTMPILDRIQASPQDEALATSYGAREHELLGERSSFTRELSART
jgi:methionyl-tRNA formyltransferase